MKRAAEERDRTRREWRKHWESHLRAINPGKGQTVQCACDKQPGRFRKLKAHACGRPRCQICHSHKYPKRQPTIGERRAMLAALAMLAGCAHAPDPQAPVVLKEAQTIEVPVAVHREPPPEWLQPMGLESPEILPAGQGDYCMTRESTRQYIAVIRAAAERLNGWKAWAGEPPRP